MGPELEVRCATGELAVLLAGRPWLQAAERASQEAQRIIVAADQGGGHGHIRHEGWVTEEASLRRGGRHHVCASLSSRIAAPDAFATALARGAGHPEVRAALSTPYDRDSRPDPVRVPIAALPGR